MNLDSDSLLRKLEPFLSSKSFVLGLSGGMDSIVLLSLLNKLANKNQIKSSLRAIHVNHHLHKDSDIWQKFCESICDRLGVDLYCESVDLTNEAEIVSSLENRARELRYGVFESQLATNEMLLLAHHQDDQMETLLFRLMRGSSLQGLSAIPAYRKLAKSSLLRPLLDVPRSALMSYAEKEELEWIEDDSNSDTKFDRNFLRHEILPLVEARWPSYRAGWQKSLRLISEANSMLEELAVTDLAAVSTKKATVLSIDQMLKISQARQRNLISFWIKENYLPDLGWHRLQQLVTEFLTAESEREGILEADGYSLGRYRQRLYLLDSVPMPEQCLDWQPIETPKLSIPGSGKLLTQEVIGKGIALDQADSLEVRFREGGESCRVKGRPTKSLKKLFQEAHIEPWWRDRLPLIYRGEQLVCIPSIGVSELAAAENGKPGLDFHWEPCMSDKEQSS